MPELNRAERRSLVTGTILVVAAGAVRLGAGGAGDLEWTPPPGMEVRPEAELRATRKAVDRALAREERASRPLAPGERIDPNLAPAVELERLPGIGPSRAQAIIEDRRLRGPFRTLDDLARVPGIGAATLRRLEPSLTLRRAPSGRTASTGPDTRTGRGAGANVPAPASTGTSPGAAARAPPPRLDVNRATQAELERLPGIGPARALKVIATRERLGGFDRVDDLLEVPGIGPATLEKLRPLVYVP